MHRFVWVLGLLAISAMAACAGEDGKAGEAGAIGTNGSTGTEGADGTPGADGAPGDDGAPGVAASATDIKTAADLAVADSLAGAVQGAVDTAIDKLGATSCDQMEIPDADEYDAFSEISYPIKPGEEWEVCKYFKLSDKDFWLHQSTHLMNAGSHHGIVYIMPFDEIPTVDPTGVEIPDNGVFPCPGGITQVSNTVVAQIAGAMSTNVEDNPAAPGVLPDDVAFKIPANAVLLMDYHLLNATDHDLDACAKFAFKSIPKKDVEQEAGFMFLYDSFITVPAEGKATAHKSCPVTSDVTMKTAVSHMHLRGVDYSAQLLDGDPYDSGTEQVDIPGLKSGNLYETKEWDGNPVRIFDKALKLEEGQFIDFKCKYDNAEDRDVAQGLDTVDEMCVFSATYWPKDYALENCNTSDSDDVADFRAAGYNRGTGDMTGTEFLGCFWDTVSVAGAPDLCGFGECENNEAKFDFQSCFNEACDAVGKYTVPYFNCMQDNLSDCQADCTAAQPNFQAQCSLMVALDGGCKEKYGTNGSDGTCATDPAVTTAAVTTCTTGARADIIDGICDDLCAGCDGSDVPACTACKGVIDYMPGTLTCLNQQTLLCVSGEVKTSATACVTECFTGCITNEITNCTVTECVNGDKCLPEVTGLATTACD